MKRCRLLAIDLDGTLLRDDGEIDRRDLAAIVAARDRGLQITLATGRLGHTTWPIAHQLQLSLPLICADGALSVCAQRGTVLARHCLPAAATARAIALATTTASPLLFVGSDHILGLPDQRGMANWLAGWSDRFVPLASLDDVLGASEPPLAAFLLGPRAQIEALAGAFGADPRWAVDAFALGQPDLWALRVRPAGIDKGSGLGALARRLGIDRDETAAVGDWHNDLPLFAWAGDSFAMGHAPAEVAAAAGHRLIATSARGGGVAEALDLLQARSHHA
jgi:hydroxymethylpyrimidine pyrophosphatase-like HAD family hydrolase